MSSPLAALRSFLSTQPHEEKCVEANDKGAKVAAATPVTGTAIACVTEKALKNQSCNLNPCNAENKQPCEQKQDEERTSASAAIGLVTPATGAEAVCVTEKALEYPHCKPCNACNAEKSSYAEQIAEWRASISSVRSDLPDIEKLKTVSLRFLDSPEAALALENGWDAASLFGMHGGQAPRERIDCWGLVLFIAWGIHRSTIETVSEKVCALRTSGGAVHNLPRHRANSDEAVRWWRHPYVASEGEEDTETSKGHSHARY
jgi:hypothetical protein